MDRPQAKGIHLHQVMVLPKWLPDMGMEPLYLLQCMGHLDPHLKGTKCRP